MDTTVINGHKVPTDYVHLFLDGETGEPISDEQWDEQMNRLRQFEPEFKVPTP